MSQGRRRAQCSSIDSGNVFENDGENICLCICACSIICSSPKNELFLLFIHTYVIRNMVIMVSSCEMFRLFCLYTVEVNGGLCRLVTNILIQVWNER